MNRVIPILLLKVVTTVLAASLTACNDSGNVESAAHEMSLDGQIEIATKDLAARLGIEAESITVADVRQVQWRSGALGCPEPGMNYTQAIEPGILIQLTAGAERYGYHARQGGKPFFCPADRAEKAMDLSPD